MLAAAVAFGIWLFVGVGKVPDSVTNVLKTPAVRFSSRVAANLHVRVVVPVHSVFIINVRSCAVDGVGNLLDSLLFGASPVGFSSSIGGFRRMVLVVLACVGSA